MNLDRYCPRKFLRRCCLRRNFDIVREIHCRIECVETSHPRCLRPDGISRERLRLNGDGYVSVGALLFNVPGICCLAVIDMPDLKRRSLRDLVLQWKVLKAHLHCLPRLNFRIRVRREVEGDVVCRNLFRVDCIIVRSRFGNGTNHLFRLHHRRPHLHARREGSLRRAHKDLRAVAHRHRRKIHRGPGLLSLLHLEIGREGSIRIDCRDIRNKDSVCRYLHAVFRPVDKFVAVLCLRLRAGQSSTVHTFYKSFRLL